MAVDGSRPLAALGAALLRPRGGARRVPIMFAPALDDLPEPPVAHVPEVVRQVVRLHDAFAPAPAAPADHAPQRKVAFTLRLDPAHHARLHALARAEGRSAQALLLDAIALYQSAAGPDADDGHPLSRLKPIGRVS